MNYTIGARLMTYVLLGEGQNVSYDKLKSDLGEGKVLVATWQVILSNVSRACLVIDEDSLDTIVRMARDGVRYNLRWFASTTGSTNPADYSV